MTRVLPLVLLGLLVALPAAAAPNASASRVVVESTKDRENAATDNGESETCETSEAWCAFLAWLMERLRS